MHTAQADAPPSALPRKIQIVPLVGLPFAAALLGLTVYAIGSDSLWLLFLCHVAGGGLWTAIDLAMRPLDFDDGVAPGWELEHLHDER